MPSERPMPGRCGVKCRKGGFCTQKCLAGLKRCRMHVGMSMEKARAKGAVVVELGRWGLGDATVDPGEVLLRLVTQSAQRAEMYARLLEEAYDAAARLKRAHEAELITLIEPEERSRFEGDNEIIMPEHAAKQAARADLERIFNVGGVAALIGHSYTSTKDGDVFATGEAIRGLAKLEAEERDRCANFAAKAVAAGLAERAVRVAERQGREMAGVFRRVLEQLGLTAEQQALVPQLLAREIGALTGKNLIDGSVA